MITRKQQERIDRAEDRADRLARKAGDHFGRAREIIAPIPPGQPILVGHHSERGHRRAIERHDAAMRRGVEAADAAEQARWSAGNAGRAITSDDPEAVDALEAKLTEMEERRELIKRVNRAHRKGGWAAVTEIIGEGRARTMEANLPHWEKKPFPAYVLQNLGANIRRVKGRIEELRAESERAECDELRVEGEGFTVEEDRNACRVRFYFDSKPSAETRSVLKANGFRWAPSEGAWQRLNNDAGRRAAERVVESLR